jgi:hypothetical protein
MTQTERQPPTPQALKQGYEPSDINVRALFVFIIIFILSAVVIQIGLWELLKFYTSLPRSADVVTSAAPAPQRFPAPNLQPIEKHNQLPWEDLADLQHEKGMIFEQLGWPVNDVTKQPQIPDSIVTELAKGRPQNPATSHISVGTSLPALEPPPQPSPGVPGEGVSSLPLRGEIANTPVSAHAEGRP